MLDGYAHSPTFRVRSVAVVRIIGSFLHVFFSIAAFWFLIVVASGSANRNEKPDEIPSFNCDADDDSPEWPWVANTRSMELTEHSCAERTKAWVQEQLLRLQAWKAASFYPNGTHSTTSSGDPDFGPLSGFGAGQQSLQPLLFFLHVPRTGGRTFHAW